MKIVVFLSFILAGLCVNAQQNLEYCGAELSPEQITWLKNYQQQANFQGTRTGDEVSYVPIQAHIVGSDDGFGYFKLQYLLMAICELNERFDSVGMYFILNSDINFIDNSAYYEHDFSVGQQMMYENNVDDVFNMYFVNAIGNTGGGSYIAGYYSYGPDAVAIRNGSGTPGGTTITHEVGHYMSMPHTFSGWEYGTPSPSNQEMVDGSNCNTAGDGFCDTPPDYAPYPWNCPMVGPFYDPDSVEFFVDDTYYMSYAQGTCKEKFSNEQSAAMKSYLLSNRSNLLLSAVPYDGPIDTMNLLVPEDSARFLDPDNVLLEWEGIEGAESYHVTIGYNRIFSAIAQEAIVSETSFLATGLTPLRNLHWKVKPIFPGNTCAPYSKTQVFETGERILSTIEDPSSSETFLKIYPNPISGNELRMDFNSLNQGKGSVSIIDFGGRVIYNRDIEIKAGPNSITIKESEFASGVYFIQLITGQERLTSKLISVN